MTPSERMEKIKEFLSHFGDLENIELNQDYSHAYGIDEISWLKDNLFFCGGVRTPKKWWADRKTKPADIVYKNYFAIDIDLRKQFAQKNWCDVSEVTDEQLFEQIDSVKEMLSWHDLLKQWSYIVFTGNGCHIYYCWYRWAVGNEISAEEYQEWVKEVYRSWNIFTNNIWGDFNYFYSDNSTANIDRILRLPYSYNAKPSNPGGRKIPVKIMYQQDEVSDMVEHLKEYAEQYRKFQKEINTVEYKNDWPVDKGSFMYNFVHYCDWLKIRDVLDKLWVRYSWHSLYEWDRKTSGWKIWDNCVVNYSDDASDSGRPEWWCYAFVKNYLKHQERKETVAWFKDNFPEVKRWAEENSDKFEKKDWLYIPEIQYDSASLAAKLADPIFDELGCIYKWDIATIVAEWNSGKTTFALDIARRNEAEWRKCFYLNLEFWLETTFQRRRQEKHWLNKIQLTEISEQDRANLNSYVASCLSWIHHSSEKDITLDRLKELLLQLWKEGYSLVIVDTFSKIDGNMWNNSWSCQNKCMSELEDFAKRTWLAILLLHHTNKLKKFSGSQKIFDLSKVFYTISTVEWDDSLRKYVCEKDKFWSTNHFVLASYKAWEYSLYEDPF